MRENEERYESRYLSLFMMESISGNSAFVCLALCQGAIYNFTAMTTLENVYRILKEKEGDFVSGESLASSLGISRAAVWKAVSSLQEKGYEIETRKHHGYRMTPCDDYNELSLSRLSPVKVFFHDEIASTNDEARRLVSSGEKPPFVVVAARQSGGKGRRGRSFSSPEGGVYLSIVIHVRDGMNIEHITTAAALGVARTIDSLGFDSQIKWVNDIYLNGKKAVGILCEGVVSMEDFCVNDVVIGIGVNYTTADFPPELRGIVTSLYPEGKAEMSRAEFAAFEIRNVLSSLSDENYIDEYRKKCFIIGMDVNVITPKGTREARALDIDRDAHLVVRYSDGSRESLSSGEVTIRPALEK